MSWMKIDPGEVIKMVEGKESTGFLQHQVNRNHLSQSSSETSLLWYYLVANDFTKSYNGGSIISYLIQDFKEKINQKFMHLEIKIFTRANRLWLSRPHAKSQFPPRLRAPNTSPHTPSIPWLAFTVATTPLGL